MTDRQYRSQKPITRTRTMMMKQMKLAAVIAKAHTILYPSFPNLLKEEKPRVKEQTKALAAFEQMDRSYHPATDEDAAAGAYAGDLLWGAPLAFWRASWLLTVRLPIPVVRKPNGSLSPCE